MDNPPQTSIQTQSPFPSADAPIPVEIEIESPKLKIPPKYKKLFLPLTVALIIFIGLGATLVLTKQRQQTTTRASLDLVDLTLSGQANIGPGEEATINVLSNPHLYKISAVDLKIKYPAEKFDFISLSPSDYLPTILTEAKSMTGVASIVLGSGTTPKTGSGVVAQLKLKAKTDFSGSGLISISTESQIAGIDSQGNAIGSNLLGDAGSISVSPKATVTPTGSPTATVTASPTVTSTPTPTGFQPSPTPPLTSTPSPTILVIGTPTTTPTLTPTPVSLQSTPPPAVSQPNFFQVIFDFFKNVFLNLLRREYRKVSEHSPGRSNYRNLKVTVTVLATVEEPGSTAAPPPPPRPPRA